MENIIDVIVNNGVAIAVIVYFMWSQSTFLKELNESIKALSECVKSLKVMIETLHNNSNDNEVNK